MSTLFDYFIYITIVTQRLLTRQWDGTVEVDLLLIFCNTINFVLINIVCVISRYSCVKKHSKVNFKMEFTPSQMQALATLLRPPEPEVLQGEDLQSTGKDFII